MVDYWIRARRAQKSYLLAMQVEHSMLHGGRLMVVTGDAERVIDSVRRRLPTAVASVTSIGHGLSGVTFHRANIAPT